DNQASAVTTKLTELVKGVGEQGCGFESQLESIYRFLVDPAPYASIGVVDGKATPTGVDPIVIQQRADFLRPDSALVVLLFSDENDCSTREGGQYFLAGQGTSLDGKGAFHLPHPRSECAVDPKDPCCVSCGQTTPTGCPPSQADPACQQGALSDVDDPIN